MNRRSMAAGYLSAHRVALAIVSLSHGLNKKASELHIQRNRGDFLDPLLFQALAHELVAVRSDSASVFDYKDLMSCCDAHAEEETG